MTYYRLTEEARATKKKLPLEVQATLLDVLESLCESPTDGRRLQGTPIWIHKHPEHNLQITYKFNEEENVIEFLDFVVAAVVFTREVFISYSHEDKSWFKILHDKLAPLEDLGVKFWADTDIEVGQLWDQKIKERLSMAKAALLLVSNFFLSSDFIRKTELPALLEAAGGNGTKSQFRLMWFLVSPCDLEADSAAREIGKYQALHDPKKPLAMIKKKKRDKVLDRMLKKIARTIAN